MNDFDPSLPNLELSQEELESLHRSLSEALVVRGEISDNPGVYPPEDESTTYSFTSPLPKEFVRDTFYPSDDNLIVCNDSQVSYCAPHRIDQEDEETTDNIFVSLNTKLAGTGIDCNQFIRVTHSRGVYDASFNTEYSRNDRRISPNDIPNGLDINDPESVKRLLDDLEVLERPLSFEDAEKLRKIEAFITTS